MIHGDFLYRESHTAPLNGTFRRKIFLSFRFTCSRDMKGGVGGGGQKRPLLGGQTGGSANKDPPGTKI